MTVKNMGKKNIYKPTGTFHSTLLITRRTLIELNNLRRCHICRTVIEKTLIFFFFKSINIYQ